MGPAVKAGLMPPAEARNIYMRQLLANAGAEISMRASLPAGSFSATRCKFTVPAVLQAIQKYPLGRSNRLAGTDS